MRGGIVCFDLLSPASKEGKHRFQGDCMGMGAVSIGQGEGSNKAQRLKPVLHQNIPIPVLAVP